jgi:ligand-binding sensor domain-containing protein
VSLFLLFCLSASAGDRTIAQFVHKAWVGKDGAPASIMAITQTKDGYLWLASSEGLYRFDGVEFERFALSGQRFTSVPVYSLLACPNGDLWVGSAVSGISRIRNGTTRNYTTADGFPDHAVLSIARDQQGAIWAATQGGLVQFDGTRWRKIGSASRERRSACTSHEVALCGSARRKPFFIVLEVTARFIVQDLGSYGSCTCWNPRTVLYG